VIPIHPIAKHAGNMVTHRLTQPCLGKLRLCPSGRLLLFSLVSVLIGGGLIAFANFVNQGSWLDGITLALGGLFVVLGLALPFVTERFEFNKDTGQFRCQKFLLSKSRPLADIVLVQLIDGGLHTMQSQNGHPVKFRSYELNLVLAGEPTIRLNLTNHSNLESTRQVAVRLVEFLNVPYHDDIENPQTKPAEEPDFNRLFAAR